jgi:mannose-6-phosphate isomerase-like protein (cupin superfamily)
LAFEDNAVMTPSQKSVNTHERSEAFPETYQVAQLDALDPVRCPCGWARRAFADIPRSVASLHLVEILEDAQPHYHKKMTEIYVILEGEGHLELDGELIPVRPMSAIYIPPGCVHRAVGRMKLINIPVPAFDPSDEYVVDSSNRIEMVYKTASSS